MSSNFTKWGVSHKKIAQEYLKVNQKLVSLPEKILDWISIARPQVEGKNRNFFGNAVLGSNIPRPDRLSNDNWRQTDIQIHGMY